MIVLVHGPDAATARAAVTKVLNEHDPDGGSTTHLDGRSVALAQAATMIGTPGFLGQSRVIVIEHLMARASKGSAVGEAAGDDGEAPSGRLDLGPLFRSVAPGNLLILVDPTLASIQAAIKKAAPRDARVISGEPLRGKPLLDWMQHVARSAGSDLPSAVAREIAELLFPQTWSARPSNPRYDRPPDLSLIRNEIEKLALAAHPGSIERSHVREMSEAGGVDRLFPFIEAMMSGAIGKATADLSLLRDAGEDGHRLSAQLYQQIELAAVHESAERKLDPVEIGRAIALPNPNRMVGIARATRRLPARLAINEARTIDRAVKTGELRDPFDALYGLMPTLAGATPPGKQRRSG